MESVSGQKSFMEYQIGVEKSNIVCAWDKCRRALWSSNVPQPSTAETQFKLDIKSLLADSK